MIDRLPKFSKSHVNALTGDFFSFYMDELSIAVEG